MYILTYLTFQAAKRVTNERNTARFWNRLKTTDLRVKQLPSQIFMRDKICFCKILKCVSLKWCNKNAIKLL